MTRETFRLVVPKQMLKQLESGGIYCQTWVTAEKQARADRWVLRGVESGGSTKEVGRYVSFFAPDGKRLAWLQRLDRIGSNGVHAVVVAPELVSVEMARIGQTYQLLIVRHRMGRMQKKRPEVEAFVLFRGVDGQLSEELCAQGLAPEFFTRSGEIKPIPAAFSVAVKLVSNGVSCVNCKHCHGLVERIEQQQEEKDSKQVVSIASGGGVL
ncbi:MAG: hypothetical protein ACRD7E_27115 [Bryobacteraceae bacterium]